MVIAMVQPARSLILDEMREWLADDSNREFQRDKRLRAIESVLQKTGIKEKDKALIASHLGILANWYLILGAVRILEGDVSGWHELSRGMQVDYWHIRILVGQWEADPRRNKQARVELTRPSLCLALAMALQDHDAINWLGGRFAKSVDDGAFGKWGLSHLPPFILGLYGKYAGQHQSEPALGELDVPGPYAPVFESWLDEEKLPKAVERICDFHVERSEDRTDESVAEFSRYPFNILPVEVYAIRAVRLRDGLAMVPVNHPLLQEPLHEVPEGVPVVNDELLERVKSIA